MIDIDHLERRIKYRDEDEPLLPPSPEEVLALIAEIRRLRGISSTQQVETKWFVEGKEHRKCPLCRNDEMFVGTETGNETRNWVQCTRCGWYARSGDRRRK